MITKQKLCTADFFIPVSQHCIPVKFKVTLHKTYAKYKSSPIKLKRHHLG